MSRETKPELHWNDAAEQREVSGLRWFCKGCNREMLDERMARYCCHTHRDCEDCGQKICGKSYTVCDNCRYKRAWERWQTKPEIEWNGEFPICMADGNNYFWCIDDLVSYIEEQRELSDDGETELPVDYDVSIFMIEGCEPSRPRGFEVDEFLCDDLGEDGELLANRKDQDALNELVNEWIIEHAPKLYYGNGNRLKSADIQEAVDAYVKEHGSAT